ncbi:MAG: XRE family transcriptional regulator [Plesiomonas shigelloides]
MTGYELRLWRKSLGWDAERAAEELGICLRTYKNYESAKNRHIKKRTAMSTVPLSLNNMLSTFRNPGMTKENMIDLLQTMIADVLRCGSEDAALDARGIQQRAQKSD